MSDSSPAWSRVDLLSAPFRRLRHLIHDQGDMTVRGGETLVCSLWVIETSSSSMKFGKSMTAWQSLVAPSGD